MTIRPSEGWDPPVLPDPLAAYRSFRSGAWEIVAAPHRQELARALLGPLAVEALLQALGGQAPPDGAMPPKSGAPGGRGAVMEVDCDDGTSIILKALRRGGLPARLRGGYYGHSRLLSEMSVIERAYSRGIPTPAPAFGASGRRPDGTEVGILATQTVPEAVSLGTLLDGATPSGGASRSGSRRRGEKPGDPQAALAPSYRAGALRAAGEAVSQAHDHGLDHTDLNIGNILLARQGPGWKGVIIDLGLSGLGEALEPGARASNLVRLLRSAEKHLGEDPRRLRDAAAFLGGYLGTKPDPHRRRRRELLAAIRRRLPAITLHRLGWKLLGRS